MHHYTNAEFANIHFVYGAKQRSCSYSMHVQQLFKDCPLLCIILILPPQKFCDILQFAYHDWNHKIWSIRTQSSEAAKMLWNPTETCLRIFNLNLLNSQSISIRNRLHESMSKSSAFVEQWMLFEIRAGNTDSSHRRYFIRPPSTTSSTASTLHVSLFVPCRNLFIYSSYLLLYFRHIVLKHSL